MPWYLIIQALYDYLVAASIVDEVMLGLPDFNTIAPDGKTLVYIMREIETQNNMYDGGEGVCTLLIGCVTSDVEVSMGKGYSRLNELEVKLYEAIEEWAAQDIPVPDLNVLRIENNESAGDPYCVRPIVGSLCNLKIEWSKRTL